MFCWLTLVLRFVPALLPIMSGCGSPSRWAFTTGAPQAYNSRMNRNERILGWLLRLAGVVMLTALGAVVMPFDWMDSFHRQAGLGALPHVPIAGYG